MDSVYLQISDVQGQSAWTAELWQGTPGEPGAQLAGGRKSFTRDDLEAPMDYAGQTFDLRRETVLDRVRSGDQPDPLFLCVGKRLAEMLTRAEVFGEWQQRRRAAPSGLRTYLRLPESLSDYPWELLCAPRVLDLYTFPFVEETNPIVRVHREWSARDWTTEGVTRILLVAGEDYLVPDRDPDRAREELRPIREAFHNSGLSVVVELCEYPESQGDLEFAIHETQPHILHFIGHGMYVGAPPEFALKLGGVGGTWPWSARAIYQFFQGSRWKPRLVLLNACHAGEEIEDSAPGTVALLEAGIPAVIGARATLRVDQSRVFARTFYHGLAAGQAIDVAMAAARGEIQREMTDGDRRRHWALPILTVAAPPDSILQFRACFAPLKSSEDFRDVLSRPGSFVNHAKERRQLLLRIDPHADAVPKRGLILQKTSGSGASWLPKRIVRDMLDAGFCVRYAEMARPEASGRRSIDVLADWRGLNGGPCPVRGRITKNCFTEFDRLMKEADGAPCPPSPLTRQIFDAFKEGIQCASDGRKLLLVLDRLQRMSYPTVSQQDFRDGLLEQLLLRIGTDAPDVTSVYTLVVARTYGGSPNQPKADFDVYGLDMLSHFDTVNVPEMPFQDSQIDNLFDEFSDYYNDEYLELVRTLLRKGLGNRKRWGPAELNMVRPIVDSQIQRLNQ